MLKITFPDNSVKEFESGITPLQIAKSISPRLAQDVLAASVNGQEWDLSRPITEDAEIKLFKWEDAEGKHAFWHSSAHLLAEALQELFPGVKFGIGPAIENGFYYDIDPGEHKITSDDFDRIEKKMLELARNKEAIVRKDIAKADAAAASLKLTAEDAKSLGIVEKILSEKEIGKKEFYERIRTLLTEELRTLSGDLDLTGSRYERFRRIGACAAAKEKI